MKLFTMVVIAMLTTAVLGATRNDYLDVMEKSVGAYSDERIAEYIAQVEQSGIKEHGFARLTSNIGILIAQGRLANKKSTYKKLMDLCALELPRAHKRNGYKAGNDFAVKEIVLSLLEVEKAKVFDKEVTDGWRNALKPMLADEIYSCRPKLGDKTAHNWVVFATASEQARLMAGLGGEAEFVEKYIADQLRFFDENGMYKDPNQPMVYDMVTRLQFAVALYCGYNGKSRGVLEDQLLKSADLTLALQSVTGEIPYGGRSNQFLHNETFYAALCEFYARWFKQRGEVSRAAKFRAAADRALVSLNYWLSQPDFRHIKNHYPLETKFGCEGYGYFNKYMVTTGSWAMLAWLFADETIAPDPIRAPAEIFTTSKAFHRTVMRAGDYTAQFDVAADGHYDANGLGRVQRKGSPPMLCLSVPFPAGKPAYTLDMTNATALAIMPNGYTNGYKLVNSKVEGTTAQAQLKVKDVEWLLELTVDGLKSHIAGKGNVFLTIPAFEFDGANKSVIKMAKQKLEIEFGGWKCEWTTDGEFVDTNIDYANRNGHYRRFDARGKDVLNAKVRIYRTERSMQ